MNRVYRYPLRYLTLLFLVIGCAVWLCHRKSGFNLNRISSSLDYRQEWVVDPLTVSFSSLDGILSQPFYYMKSGSQSYAFVSQDDKYVLKFFRMNHLTPKKWLKFFPVPGLKHYRYKKIQKREERAEQTFGAIKVAYEGFKEDSGLIFIHLNRTGDLNKEVLLLDRAGKRFYIPLDTTPFILQERAELIYPHLDSLMQKRDTAGTIRALRSLLSMIWRRGCHGFVDKDNGVSNNYGFVGERAIQIDVGCLALMKEEERTNPQTALSELKKFTERLKIWMDQYYPELSTELLALAEEFSKR